MVRRARASLPLSPAGPARCAQFTRLRARYGGGACCGGRVAAGVLRGTCCGGRVAGGRPRNCWHPARPAARAATARGDNRASMWGQCGGSGWRVCVGIWLGSISFSFSVLRLLLPPLSPLSSVSFSLLCLLLSPPSPSLSSVSFSLLCLLRSDCLSLSSPSPSPPLFPSLYFLLYSLLSPSPSAVSFSLLCLLLPLGIRGRARPGRAGPGRAGPGRCATHSGRGVRAIPMATAWPRPF